MVLVSDQKPRLVVWHCLCGGCIHRAAAPKSSPFKRLPCFRRDGIVYYQQKLFSKTLLSCRLLKYHRTNEWKLLRRRQATGCTSCLGCGQGPSGGPPLGWTGPSLPPLGVVRLSSRGGTWLPHRDFYLFDNILSYWATPWTSRRYLDRRYWSSCHGHGHIY